MKEPSVCSRSTFTIPRITLQYPTCRSTGTSWSCLRENLFGGSQASRLIRQPSWQVNSNSGTSFLVLFPDYIFLVPFPDYIFLVPFPDCIFIVPFPDCIFLVPFSDCIFLVPFPDCIFLVPFPDCIFLVLFPDCIFYACRKNRSGQLPIPFSFMCAGMLAHCSFLILCLLSSKIAFHIACQRYTSEMDIDLATLAAVCRLRLFYLSKGARVGCLGVRCLLESEFRIQLT